MNNSDFPKVSIVVIGKNEANNLKECFNGIDNLNYPKEKLEILFVDSNSKDNSIEIAKQYTDNVFKIKSKSATAGKAFNKGIVESSAHYVHITSGDIKLAPNYLNNAIKFLESNKNIEAVTGYFVEKNNKGWNKIIGFRREEESYVKGQFVDTPNGGTFRKMALIEVNGYDERIKKGQETDLGKNFKKKGYKIWHMPIKQGVHDFDVSSFTKLIKRNISHGKSLGHLLLLSIHEKENENFRMAKKNASKNLFIHSVFLAGLIILLQYHPLLALVWFIFYVSYFIVINIFKKNISINYRIYKIVMGLLSFFTYCGIITFFVCAIKEKIRGKKIYKQKSGLSLFNKNS